MEDKRQREMGGKTLKGQRESENYEETEHDNTNARGRRGDRETIRYRY